MMISGYLMENEAGEEFYAYAGEPVVARSDIDALTHQIVAAGMCGDSIPAWKRNQPPKRQEGKGHSQSI